MDSVESISTALVLTHQNSDLKRRFPGLHGIRGRGRQCAPECARPGDALAGATAPPPPRQKWFPSGFFPVTPAKRGYPQKEARPNHCSSDVEHVDLPRQNVGMAFVQGVQADTSPASFASSTARAVPGVPHTPHAAAAASAAAAAAGGAQAAYRKFSSWLECRNVNDSEARSSTVISG